MSRYKLEGTIAGLESNKNPGETKVALKSFLPQQQKISFNVSNSIYVLLLYMEVQSSAKSIKHVTGTLGNETFDIRKATFTNSSADRVPSLCRAGFFSRGADIILCFRCSAQVDLTLQNPGHDDDSIWRFHAR